MIRLIPISPPRPAETILHVPVLEQLSPPGVLFEDWLKQLDECPPHTGRSTT